jgi:hypothetical protein
MSLNSFKIKFFRQTSSFNHDFDKFMNFSLFINFMK